MLPADRTAVVVPIRQPPRDTGFTPAGPVLVIEAVLAARLLFPRIAAAQMFDIRFSRLRRSLIKSLDPGCVVAPLMGSDFDVLDVAARLAETGFCGTLYALSPCLPRPRLIPAEVHAIAPQLDFAMVEQAA